MQRIHTVFDVDSSDVDGIAYVRDGVLTAHARVTAETRNLLRKMHDLMLVSVATHYMHEGATQQNTADLLGVNRSTFFQHVGSKRHLLSSEDRKPALTQSMRHYRSGFDIVEHGVEEGSVGPPSYPDVPLGDKGIGVALHRRDTVPGIMISIAAELRTACSEIIALSPVITRLAIEALSHGANCASHKEILETVSRAIAPTVKPASRSNVFKLRKDAVELAAQLSLPTDLFRFEPMGCPSSVQTFSPPDTRQAQVEEQPKKLQQGEQVERGIGAEDCRGISPWPGSFEELLRTLREGSPLPLGIEPRTIVWQEGADDPDPVLASHDQIYHSDRQRCIYYGGDVPRVVESNGSYEIFLGPETILIRVDHREDQRGEMAEYPTRAFVGRGIPRNESQN